MSNFVEYVLKDPRCKPFVGSETAAGVDLRVYLGSDPRNDGIVIPPGGFAKFGTGVSVAIPDNWVGLIAPRSSCGKLRISLSNTVGVIDSDYRGEIMAEVHNFGTEEQILYNFDRLVQMVIIPHYPTALWEEVTELNTTKRGDGGFGHSGRN